MERKGEGEGVRGSSKVLFEGKWPVGCNVYIACGLSTTNHVVGGPNFVLTQVFLCQMGSFDAQNQPQRRTPAMLSRLQVRERQRERDRERERERERVCVCVCVRVSVPSPPSLVSFRFPPSLFLTPTPTHTHTLVQVRQSSRAVVRAVRFSSTSLPKVRQAKQSTPFSCCPVLLPSHTHHTT